MGLPSIVETHNDESPLQRTENGKIRDISPPKQEIEGLRKPNFISCDSSPVLRIIPMDKNKQDEDIFNKSDNGNDKSN